jgi:hypothetical protein
LLADGLSLYGVLKYRDAEHRMRWVKIGCVLLPVAFTSVFLLWGEPVKLVFVGALAQAMMLPFLALAALYFRYRRTASALRPGGTWTFCLWFATAAMSAVGAYQLVTKLKDLVK